MKRLLLFFGLLINCGAFAKEVPLTIDWTFTNVEDGYDHQNKIKIYIDDAYKGESGSFLQTNRSTYQTMVETGTHRVRIVNYALYEGKWEEHLIVNDYSIDALFDETIGITKATKIAITWDLNGSHQIKITGGKPPKPAKGGGKDVTLTIEWKFTGVIDGYDHDNRVEVFVDDKFIGTSGSQKQTKKGTYVIKVPKGSHSIRIMDYALYNGEWEEHTKENEYSVDAFVNETIDFKGPKTITIDFNIDTEETTYKIK